MAWVGVALDWGVEDADEAVCLRCCCAYWSRAACEGSFRERKPSTELAFFFFLDDRASFVEEAVEAREARLDDVTEVGLERE